MRRGEDFRPYMRSNGALRVMNETKNVTPWLCKDCGVDTEPGTNRRGRRYKGCWESYYVRDDVWAAAGMEKYGGFVLCIGCLEKRLGRRLMPRDFLPFPMNYPDDPWHTARLADRIHGTDRVGGGLRYNAEILARAIAHVKGEHHDGAWNKYHTRIVNNDKVLDPEDKKEISYASFAMLNVDVARKYYELLPQYDVAPSAHDSERFRPEAAERRTEAAARHDR
jgi:hypothetical protein